MLTPQENKEFDLLWKATKFDDKESRTAAENSLWYWVASPADVKSFLNQVAQNHERIENKEWREGRRCDICGDEKEAGKFTTICANCLEKG